MSADRQPIVITRIVLPLGEEFVRQKWLRGTHLSIGCEIVNEPRMEKPRIRVRAWRQVYGLDALSRVRRYQLDTLAIRHGKLDAFP